MVERISLTALEQTPRGPPGLCLPAVLGYLLPLETPHFHQFCLALVCLPYTNSLRAPWARITNTCMFPFPNPGQA